MKKLFPLFLLLIFLVLLGCADGNVPFSGKVTFSDDGSPLTAGTVCFVSNTNISRGKLSSDGTYILGSLKSNDGLPPGSYQVYVSDANEPPKHEMEEYGAPLIDVKFTDARTSELNVEVSKSVRTFDFQVDRSKPKR